MSKPKERAFAGTTDRTTTFIALLRGINVGGHKKVPMTELRDIASRLGWDGVQSYIQSGNLVFSAGVTQSVAELALERSILKCFGFAADVVVRTSDAWQAYAAGSPFVEAQEERPHLLHLGLSKRPPQPDAIETLRRYAAAGEKIEIVDGCHLDRFRRRRRAVQVDSWRARSGGRFDRHGAKLAHRSETRRDGRRDRLARRLLEPHSPGPVGSGSLRAP